jgi:hypothetical protein
MSLVLGVDRDRLSNAVSAGLLQLGEESVDDVEDFALLLSGEFAEELEGFLDFADGACTGCERGDGGVDEDVFDADAEGFGHASEDVGAWRVVTPLPEGDVGLGDFEERGELDLCEPGLGA